MHEINIIEMTIIIKVDMQKTIAHIKAINIRIAEMEN